MFNAPSKCASVLPKLWVHFLTKILGFKVKFFIMIRVLLLKPKNLESAVEIRISSIPTLMVSEKSNLLAFNSYLGLVKMACASFFGGGSKK